MIDEKKAKLDTIWFAMQAKIAQTKYYVQKHTAWQLLQLLAKYVPKWVQQLLFLLYDL